MLYIRMGLYLLFGFLASQGVVVFDAESDTVTFQIEHVVLLISGLGGYVATFAASRIAKARGGAT